MALLQMVNLDIKRQVRIQFTLLSLILVLDHIKHFRERAITVKMDMDALWHPDRLRLATICFMLRDTISARVTGLLTM